ncbi:MAG: transposase [Actinomycetia bacterium]|nr:transposase [Actinomycetes bacterium]
MKVESDRVVVSMPTYRKVREGDRVLSMALVVATGVNAQGDREVLGCEVGPVRMPSSGRRFSGTCSTGA